MALHWGRLWVNGSEFSDLNSDDAYMVFFVKMLPLACIQTACRYLINEGIIIIKR